MYQNLHWNWVTHVTNHKCNMPMLPWSQIYRERERAKEELELVSAHFNLPPKPKHKVTCWFLGWILQYLRLMTSLKTHPRILLMSSAMICSCLPLDYLFIIYFVFYNDILDAKPLNLIANEKQWKHGNEKSFLQ